MQVNENILAFLGVKNEIKPVDPRLEMIAQINRNGDAVFRNAEVTMFLEGGGEHRFYSLSLTYSCLPRGAQWPPPARTFSLQCYEPYQQHHVYLGTMAQTKSGKPCTVRPISTVN